MGECEHCGPSAQAFVPSNVRYHRLPCQSGKEAGLRRTQPFCLSGALYESSGDLSHRCHEWQTRSWPNLFRSSSSSSLVVSSRNGSKLHYGTLLPLGWGVHYIGFFTAQWPSANGIRWMTPNHARALYVLWNTLV